jgi:hypothetical protein
MEKEEGRDVHRSTPDEVERQNKKVEEIENR